MCWPLELARGKLNDVRNQLADWMQMGLRIPPELARSLAEAQRAFVRAATSADEPEACLAAAQASLEASSRPATCSSRPTPPRSSRAGWPPPASFRPIWAASWTATRQGVPARPSGRRPSTPARSASPGGRSRPPRGSTAGTCSTPSSPGAAATSWTIEAGPLIEFRPAALPDWIWLWEGDFETISGFVAEFVRQAVQRYRGKVPLWHVVHRPARGEILGLSEEEQIRITARAVQVARQADPRPSSRIGVDRPWAEWMGSSHFQLGPLHLCDYLLRSDLGISEHRDRDRAGVHEPRAATSATCSSSPSCSTSTRC